MPKKAKELTATEVRRLTVPGLHAVGGVAGLLLQVTPTGATSWILRAVVGNKRRDIGLGGFPDVTLAQARERAREARELIRQGIDPVEQRKAAKGALLAAQAKGVTFAECADRYIAEKLGSRSAKNKEAWANTLRDYAIPVIGRLPVSAVELAHVLAVIKPIWHEKTITAKRVRGRIESILAWATVHGYREGDNPARWKGNLKEALPAPGEIHHVEHLKALPWEEAGEFMQKLRQREGIAARCLEFVILTGLRSGEVRGARWEEIDLQAKTWTVPAERMKMKKTHIVPLSDAAIRLLKAMPRLDEGSDLVFPGARGGLLSDVGLTKPIRVMGYDVTVHGFRSTFRDWMAERTNYPHYVHEMVLAHAVSNEVEKAYRRGDLLEKRAKLMGDWARYLNSPAKSADVVSIGRGTA